MNENRVISLEERVKDEAKSYLQELLSEGASKLLQAAIENKVIGICRDVLEGTSPIMPNNAQKSSAKVASIAQSSFL